MSGGYLGDKLEAFDHRVVIFNFKGPLDAAACKEWNDQIHRLKSKFLKDQVIAVTIKGEPTPPDKKTPLP